MCDRMQAGGGCRRGVVARDRDPRFQQLLALAEAGDECAAADLFREFDYEYLGGSEEVGDDGD